MSYSFFFQFTLFSLASAASLFSNQVPDMMEAIRNAQSSSEPFASTKPSGINITSDLRQSVPDAYDAVMAAQTTTHVPENKPNWGHEFAAQALVFALFLTLIVVITICCRERTKAAEARAAAEAIAAEEIAAAEAIAADAAAEAIAADAAAEAIAADAAAEEIAADAAAEAIAADAAAEAIAADAAAEVIAADAAAEEIAADAAANGIAASDSEDTPTHSIDDDDSISINGNRFIDESLLDELIDEAIHFVDYKY